jgi:hypothetical protein
MPPPKPLRPAAVPDDGHGAGVSAFDVAVSEVRAGIEACGAARPEVNFESQPPPRRLAPEATAIAATVEIGGNELGSGRFVLLYDPAGQDGWAGPLRVIAYVRAELEPEIAADPLVGQVGWSWLTEALEVAEARYAAPSGSVTTVVTEGFGMKADQPVATDFEMRASWSPVAVGRDSFQLDRHVAAWVDALCVACGMPPAAPGLAPLPPPQHRTQPRRPHFPAEQPWQRGPGRRP